MVSGDGARDLEDFIRDHYESVVRVVTVVCGNLAEAEDATQEAIARALERRARGQPIDALRPWIVTVAINVTRSRYRRARREVAERHDWCEPRADDDPTDAVVVWQAVRRLPRRQREVAALYYLGDMSVADIARMTRSSDASVKNALFKARSSLAAALRPADRTEELADDDHR